jgi:zinc protease
VSLALRHCLLRAVLSTLVLVGALTAFPLSAGATKIERIVSPGGLTAWLVREPSVPLIAFDFAFKGGATQDPPEKPGVATMAAALLDEGAGDIDSKNFHERVEAEAIELSFTATRDYVSGSLRTLTENQGEAFDLLKLALTAPRGAHTRTDIIGFAPRDHKPERARQPALVGNRFRGSPLCASAARHLGIGPGHHGPRSQGLRREGIRPRQPQDRDRW